MDTTDNLGLPYIAAAQAQKHVTHNEALRALDALVHLAVLDKDLGTPPAAPAAGARYIVGPGPAGAWAGRPGSIAAWQDGAWTFHAPHEGWLAWIVDEGRLYAWRTGMWVPLPVVLDAGSGILDSTGHPQLVFHATPGAANHLAISNAAPGTPPLLSADGTDANIDLQLAAKGAGVVRSTGQVAVSSGVYPPLRAERSTTATATPVAACQLVASSSGDMADGFAVNHDFAIQDVSAVVNNIGTLQFVRSGNDNSGRFRVLPATVGVQTTQFEIAPSGNAYFPGVATTAAAANAILNTASMPPNELFRSTSSARYKDTVENLTNECADNILRLRPVWYRSKCAADNPAWSWYGLIAEEVASIEPRLVSWGYANDDYEVVEKREGDRFVSERILKKDAQLRPDGVAYERLAVLLLSIVKRHNARLQLIENKTSYHMGKLAGST
jgi:hypothetical protein